MALDDKVFQSAIAKINKIKAKQAAFPQIQVFEDPPHLKKSANNSIENMEFSAEEVPIITEISTVIQNNTQPDTYLQNPMPIEEDHSLIDKKNNNKNDLISVSKNHIKYGTDSSTEYSTKKGTKQGTQIEINKKRVQNNSTEYSTILSTKQGTQIGYSADQNTESFLNKYPDFLYRRPYDALTGISKKIVDVIFEICRKYAARETPPVPFATLVRLCNEKKNSVKVTRQRLLDEGIIATKSPSNVNAKGRSGMLIYQIREDIYDDINNSFSLLIRESNSLHKKGTNQGTNWGTNASSSSSIKSTTTIDLPEEWKKIDVTPLKKINFSTIEIKNIFKKCPSNIDHSVVQDSINQFAFGLANNSERYKKMNAPSGILVKSLCEGTPWVENGYISMEEKLRIEKENKITQLLEAQFKQSKFLEWFTDLNENQKENLVPQGVQSSTSYMFSKEIIQKEHAKRYFEQKIWPEVLSKMKNEMI